VLFFFTAHISEHCSKIVGNATHNNINHIGGRTIFWYEREFLLNLGTTISSQCGKERRRFNERDLAGRMKWLDPEWQAWFRLSKDMPEAGVGNRRLMTKIIISTLDITFGRRQHTMDHKNVSTTSRDIGDVQKIYMILCQSHYRVVISSVGRCSDISPRNCATLCRLEGSHVEEPHFTVRHSI
jgi:hypothetical protein